MPGLAGGEGSAACRTRRRRSRTGRPRRSKDDLRSQSGNETGHGDHEQQLQGTQGPVSLLLLRQEPGTGPQAHRGPGRLHLRRVHQPLPGDHRGGDARRSRRRSRRSPSSRTRARSSSPSTSTSSARSGPRRSSRSRSTTTTSGSTPATRSTRSSSRSRTSCSSGRPAPARRCSPRPSPGSSTSRSASPTRRR